MSGFLTAPKAAFSALLADTIQKGISTDPQAPPATAGKTYQHISTYRSNRCAGQNAEAAALVASLKEVIRSQAQEIEELKNKLKAASAQKDEVCPFFEIHICNILKTQLQLEGIRAQLANVQAELQASNTKRQETEKEQEDLLVLLDELNNKRRRDKQRMKSAGMEVSEDEEEGSGR